MLFPPPIMHARTPVVASADTADTADTAGTDSVSPHRQGAGSWIRSPIVVRTKIHSHRGIIAPILSVRHLYFRKFLLAAVVRVCK